MAYRGFSMQKPDLFYIKNDHINFYEMDRFFFIEIVLSSIIE